MASFDPADLKDDDTIWSFGYGSNMDVESVEGKKGVKVLESSPAVLADYRLSFFPAMRWVEPAYANVRKEKGAEVHGVAFHMTVAGMKKLDAMEFVYGKHFVTLRSYDGRELRAFTYVFDTDQHDAEPSSRYMDILIKGAAEAGLKPSYLDGLRKIPTYQPPEAILKMRQARGKLTDHREITMEELARHKSDDEPWISVLGYVIRPFRGQRFFPIHKGRDITARQLMHLKQISLEKHDDGGKPPFPLVKDLGIEELEYITRWLDQYQAGSSKDCTTDMGEVVGHLKEFRQQQESGKSDFNLPKKL